MKSVIKPLAQIVLILLGLTAAASAAGAGIHNKILGSGNTTLTISNDEMEDIIKVVKSLEDSCLLLKRVSETIQNEAKEQKGGFHSMLLGTIAASLLGNILAGKEAIAKWQGQGIVRVGYGNKKGQRIVRAGHRSKADFLILPQPLTHFEIQKHY